MRGDVARVTAHVELDAAAEQARACLEQAQVAEHGDARGERARREGQRDVRADAGRLAGAHDDQG